MNVAASDFHEQSLYGSYHGGSLAPILDGATGLPVAVTPTLTADASQSPAIDRGDDTFAYANEPTPNGGFVNIGAFGNTAQASKSPTTYMLVTKPGGGETLITGQSFNIRWRDHNIGTGTVTIDLMVLPSSGPTTFQSTIVSGAPNSGQYLWTPAAAIPVGSRYLIRVTEQGRPRGTQCRNVLQLRSPPMFITSTMARSNPATGRPPPAAIPTAAPTRIIPRPRSTAS